MAFNVEDKIKELYGQNELLELDEAQIQLYWSWYKGYHEAFHNHRLYNGENYLYLTKKSLQMGKKVAETWADLLINERCDVSLDEKAKIDLDLILDNGKFWTKANKMVEWAFALGYSALIGEISEKGEMNFVSIDARNIRPLNIENDQITECAFYKVIGKKTRITMWTKDEKGHYTCFTGEYDEKGKPTITNELVTELDKPLYMVIKPNIVVNEENANYGISVFANSIDTLKAIDTKYDGLDFEFIGGRKRVYVSMEAMKVVMGDNNESYMTKPFDPLDSTYYNAGDVGHDGKPLIQEGGGELRAEQYITALNFELALLSHKTGLGYGYFRVEPKGEVTATQVISENSDLFRTLNKHQTLVRDEMIPFLIAVIEYSNQYCQLKVNNFDRNLDILFDDSIIEDKDTQKKNDLLEVEAGLMTHVDFAIRWEALDKDSAKKKYLYLDIVQRAESIRPLLASKTITPELAIDYIYQDYYDEKEKEKLVEYLKLDELKIIDEGEFE